MTNKNFWLYILLATTVFLGVKLSGCTGNKTTPGHIEIVHLHANSLSHSERKSVHDALVAEGFNVKLRNNPSPFNANTLIYNPYIGFERDLDKIRLALKKTEQAAEDLHVREAKNHHYTSHNIGLYLNSASTLPGQEEVLPDVPFNLTDFEFVSRDCESTYILEFYHDGKADVLGMHSDTPLATIEWTDTEGRVTLKSQEKIYKYNKTLNTKRNGANITFFIILSTDRNPTNIFGCEYQGRMTAHRLNR